MSIDLGEGGERWGGKGDAYRTPSHFSNSILLGLGNQSLCKLLTLAFCFNVCPSSGDGICQQTVLETQIQGVGGRPFGHTCSVFFHVGGRNFKAAGRRLNKLWVVPLQHSIPHSVAGGAMAALPPAKSMALSIASLSCKYLAHYFFEWWANILFPRSDIFI